MTHETAIKKLLFIELKVKLQLSKLTYLYYNDMWKFCEIVNHHKKKYSLISISEIKYDFENNIRRLFL